MRSMIKLKPTKEDDMYLVLYGKSSKKLINGTKKKVIPLSIARFIGQNILKDPPSVNINFMYDNGFAVDGKIMVPSAMSQSFAYVKLFKKGELLVATTNSDPLINSHRVLSIIDALPEINGDDIRDVRTAEGFMRNYQQQLRYYPAGTFEKLKAKLGFDPKLPKSAVNYRGKINRRTLTQILGSFPVDLNNTDLQTGGKTDLIVVSPQLPDEKLYYFLRNPEELDELQNCKLHSDFGILQGVSLNGGPSIVATSQDVRDDLTLEELSTDSVYNSSFRDPQLRALVRKAGYLESSGLALSYVQISNRNPKMCFGPEVEVTYLQGVQAVSKDEGKGLLNSSKYVKEHSFKYERGIKLDKRIDNASGIADVAIFEKSIDLSTFFSSPRDLDAFDGDVRVSGQAKQIFDKYFKEAVNTTAARIEQEKGVKVTGIVLSPIKVQSHFVDILIHIGMDPQGEYRLAATYLTKN